MLGEEQHEQCKRMNEAGLSLEGTVQHRAGVAEVHACGTKQVHRTSAEIDREARDADSAEANRIPRGDQIGTSDPDAIDAEFLDQKARSVGVNETSGPKGASGAEGET